jgi:hypothetical protein
MPHTSNISVSDQSEKATIDGSTVEYLHGPKVTSQVLMDLLANSIAIMRLDDARVDEWTNLFRDRVRHFRHGTI